MQRLINVLVTAVALVDKGANRRKFAITKMDDPSKGGKRMKDLFKKYPWFTKGDPKADKKYQSVLKALSDDERGKVAEAMDQINMGLMGLADLMGYPEPKAGDDGKMPELTEEQLAEKSEKIRETVKGLYGHLKGLSEMLGEEAPELFKSDEFSLEEFEKVGRELSSKNRGLLEKLRDIVLKILSESGVENPLTKKEEELTAKEADLKKREEAVEALEKDLEDPEKLQKRLDDLKKAQQEKEDEVISKEMENASDEEIASCVGAAVAEALKNVNK